MMTSRLYRLLQGRNFYAMIVVGWMNDSDTVLTFSTESHEKNLYECKVTVL